MLTLLSFSILVWIHGPHSATGSFFWGLSDILFPTFVLLAVLFHSFTYTLLLFKVYKVIKAKKTKEIGLKIKIARNRLWMFLGLVVVTMPVFAYAESITYADPMKEFLLDISFSLLGLNAIAMVYLFEAMGLLLSSERRTHNQLALPRQCIEMTITRPHMDGPLISATQLS
jgi:hypothetical protein